jgi:hypothetical protein
MSQSHPSLELRRLLWFTHLTVTILPWFPVWGMAVVFDWRPPAWFVIVFSTLNGLVGSWYVDRVEKKVQAAALATWHK